MKDGQTFGQWLNWDFETNGDLIIRDKNGNHIYYENSNGFWAKREYDSKGNVIYYEDSNGYWVKSEYDSQGNRIYFENSNGIITDNRTPEIIQHNGHKYQLIKQINPNETITLPTKWYIPLTEENHGLGG